MPGKIAPDVQGAGPGRQCKEAWRRLSHLPPATDIVPLTPGNLANGYYWPSIKAAKQQ
jgi:hypothetical protein